ncbi:MAG: YkgJ family cysteine cluster protein [Desulfovibrionaceae bacterium]
MLTVWAWKSLWRRFLCLVTRRAPELTGSCLQCGRCCRTIVLRSHGRWITSKRHFERLLTEDPGFERLEIRDRDEAGRIVFRCSWLAKDNRCLCYEDRLPMCRNHPTPLLWLRGVDLPPTCGYALRGPGLADLLPWRRPSGPFPSFDKVLEEEQNRMFNEPKDKDR